MAKSQEKVVALKESYDAHYPTAIRFAERVVEQVEELLAASRIFLAVPLQWRVKTLSSVMEKVHRDDSEVGNVLELHDFIGLRLILLFKSDVHAVCRLLSDNFTVIESEDTSHRLSDSEFGYQSIHYRIKLPPDWLSVPSFSQFGDFSAEVQVRTVAQHIWAAASHVLQYNRESAVPAPLRRSISRISALLETVDLEFLRLLQERKDYTESVDTSGSLAPVDVDGLEKLLDECLPAENKQTEEPYSEAVGELSAAGINALADVKRLVLGYRDELLGLEAEIVGALKKDKGGDWSATVRGEQFGCLEEEIEKGVFFSHIGFLRQALVMEHGIKKH